ncbi:MAG TPA: hypothetical protein VEY13_08210 [Rubrobacteraceae bacterium]|nr:hypothetical protein [Rubrobacteraceae bacterium]
MYKNPPKGQAKIKLSTREVTSTAAPIANATDKKWNALHKGSLTVFAIEVTGQTAEGEDADNSEAQYGPEHEAECGKGVWEPTIMN